MPDVLKLKMGLDMESIYRQLDEMSVMPRIRKKRSKTKAVKVASAKSDAEKTSQQEIEFYSFVEK